MKIAITGIIGGGKSTVSKMIAEKYPVLDTDQVTHKLLKEPAVNREIAAQILKVNDERVSRKDIAEVVFNNDKKLRQLEAIIHPLVKTEIDNWTDKQSSEHVFVEVPLLYESGFESLFDYVVVISCPESVAIERLMASRGYTHTEAQQRIAAQMSIEEKIKRADYNIVNNKGLDDLEKQVEMLLNEL